MKEIEISEQQRRAEGVKLNAYLRAQDIRQEELAMEMDVAQGTISKWCKGKKAIPVKRLYWLASRLGFNPLEFRPDLVEFMGAPVDMDRSTKEQVARIVAKVVQVAVAADRQELQRLDQIVHLVLGGPTGRPNTTPKDPEH